MIPILEQTVYHYLEVKNGKVIRVIIKEGLGSSELPKPLGGGRVWHVTPHQFAVLSAVNFKIDNILLNIYKSDHEITTILTLIEVSR